MALDFDKLTNPFLRMHLEYVRETEPPRIFHTWAALTAVAAAMQRNLYIESGIGKLYGNMYVLLVGPPGTRKSTAINLAVRALKAATEIRLAPDDTGGQRQGLIKALLEDEMTEEGLETANAMDIDSLLQLEINLDRTNAHVMFVIASEFGSFIGQNSLDLTRFLIRMWDGEDYEYRLRDSRMVLHDNLMSIIGGTTPTEIATLLPPEAIGQGYMSRNILVYAPHKEKEVPPSKVQLHHAFEADLQAVYRRVAKLMRGPVTKSSHAEDLLDHLYIHDPKLNDTRFIFYQERRQTHMQKLAMVLAVARDSMVIEQIDVEEAHRILAATEANMPDALGEYGMSPLAVAQQKMLDFLRYHKDPVSEHTLYSVMQRDMKIVDFRNSISALINAAKITAFDVPDKGRHFVFNDATARAIATMGEDALAALLGDIGPSKMLQ